MVYEGNENDPFVKHFGLRTPLVSVHLNPIVVYEGNENIWRFFYNKKKLEEIFLFNFSKFKNKFTKKSEIQI